MKIILLDDVSTLGRRGDVRDVADGYARNYLLPQKLALHATAGNMKNLEGIKARQESRASKLKADAQAQAQAIEALHFAQSRQASTRRACSDRWDAPMWRSSSARTGSRSSAGASHSTSRSRPWESSACPSGCIRT